MNAVWWMMCVCLVLLVVTVACTVAAVMLHGLASGVFGLAAVLGVFLVIGCAEEIHKDLKKLDGAE
jgi:hypothetical protein